MNIFILNEVQVYNKFEIVNIHESIYLSIYPNLSQCKSLEIKIAN